MVAFFNIYLYFKALNYFPQLTYFNLLRCNGWCDRLFSPVLFFQLPDPLILSGFTDIHCRSSGGSGLMLIKYRLCGFGAKLGPIIVSVTSGHNATCFWLLSDDATSVQVARFTMPLQHKAQPQYALCLKREVICCFRKLIGLLNAYFFLKLFSEIVLIQSPLLEKK